MLVPCFEPDVYGAAINQRCAASGFSCVDELVFGRSRAGAEDFEGRVVDLEGEDTWGDILEEVATWSCELGFGQGDGGEVDGGDEEAHRNRSKSKVFCEVFLLSLVAAAARF